MGIYEFIHDCGDGEYCISCWCSLDHKSSLSWNYCNKHKIKKGGCYTYNTMLFCLRYSGHKLYKKYEMEIIDEFESKNIYNKNSFTVMKLKGNSDSMNWETELQLKNSRKLFFSEYNDEPSWKIVGNDLIIIDILNTDSICHEPPVLELDTTKFVFDTRTRKVITCEEYDILEKQRDEDFKKWMDETGGN